MDNRLKAALEQLPETNAVAVLDWLIGMEKKVTNSQNSLDNIKHKVEIQIEELRDAEKVAYEWLSTGDYTYIPRLRKPMSDEQKKKISATMKGRTLSEQTKARMRENSQRSTVYQYDNEGKLVQVFKSTREVARKMGYNNSFISQCCRNGKKAYGYYWYYTPLEEGNPLIKMTITTTYEQ